MKANKIAVYGGAFDPFTVAHLEISKRLGEMFDEVWVLPTFKHRIKRRDPWNTDNPYQMYNSDYQSRMLMCQYSLADFHNIKVQPHEQLLALYNKQYGGATYDLAKFLEEQYPDDEFWYCVGQDNADTIETWAHYPDIMDLNYVVMSRGTLPTDTWYTRSDKATVVDLGPDYADVSSTRVRELMRNPSEYDKDKLAELVPPQVAKFIDWRFS